MNQSFHNSDAVLECLEHLGKEKEVIHRASYVLEMVAHSSVGLGEVLQDYAHQAWGQLREVIQVTETATKEKPSSKDLEILQNAHDIMKSAQKVLEMTPVAMHRNKAGTLGEKEKLSPADIMQIAHAFAHSPGVMKLLASQDAELMLAAKLAENAPANIVTMAGHTQAKYNTDNHA